MVGRRDGLDRPSDQEDHPSDHPLVHQVHPWVLDRPLVRQVHPWVQDHPWVLPWVHRGYQDRQDPIRDPLQVLRRPYWADRVVHQDRPSVLVPVP